MGEVTWDIHQTRPIGRKAPFMLQSTCPIKSPRLSSDLSFTPPAPYAEFKFDKRLEGGHGGDN